MYMTNISRTYDDKFTEQDTLQLRFHLAITNQLLQLFELVVLFEGLGIRHRPARFQVRPRDNLLDCDLYLLTVDSILHRQTSA